MAKKLIARKPILYQCREYECGAQLPANAPLVPKWIECGAAYWKTDEPVKKPKAVPLSAPAGVVGEAVPATDIEPDLVGKVPSPKARGAVTDRRKRPKKRLD